MPEPKIARAPSSRKAAAGPRLAPPIMALPDLALNSMIPPDPPPAVEQFAATLDRVIQATQARATQAISPAALMLAYADWALHLANAPGKQALLAAKVARKLARWSNYAARDAYHPLAEPCIEPLPQDHRFTHPGWRRFPFDCFSQGFLLTQQWWHNATTDVPGVDPHHEDVVTFLTRQLLDIWSPSNFLLTNPELLELTVKSGGANLVQGWLNACADMAAIAATGRPAAQPAPFKLGRDLAATPGRVVYRNELIELIRYDPIGDQVRSEPVLIVPAWIMKFYILDLSAHNSVVRYMRDQGFAVYMISWRNPGPAQANLGMEDYRELGVMAALREIGQLEEGRKIHAAGYCLGGTLLAIAAAALGSHPNNPLASLTLFTAQVDFTDPGELQLFIDESQVTYLEGLMSQQGYLGGSQMAGAFQLLRSNDMIWSHLIRLYLRGERETPNDLMAWNADVTRMPYRMHSEYLRRLFLHNDLAEGRYRAAGQSVALSNIDMPIFMVATETDHVAPWHSVYKLHFLTDAELTFLLTSGGHNAGIVSEPGHPGRHYRVSLRRRQGGEPYIDPDHWRDNVAPQDGSWWPVWADWLGQRSTGWVPAKAIGTDLGPAPGRYVFEG